MLFNPLPRLPFKKLLNGGAAHSVLSGEIAMAPRLNPWALRLRAVLSADRSNHFGSQKAIGISLPAILPSASLSGHVAQVVAVGSEPQMSGVDARGIVARMAHKHSSRDRTESHLIGNAMCKLIGAVNSEESVALRKSGRGPLPTIVLPLYVDFLPKQFGSYHMNMIAGAVTCE
jgi:hypothetical protein